MQELIVKGTTQVEEMEFTEIEGGLGKDKKCMLAKDIAVIHEKELKDINRNINNNIERFKKGIDILDLLESNNGESKPPFEEMGFSKRDLSISKNIYLLSERGYSKLLKILEDDKAWEQYEILVDRYFNMREETNSNTSSDKRLEIQEKNANVRLEYAKIKKADLILKLCNVETLSTEYKNILVNKATEVLTGELLLPMAKSEQKTYSATELGEMFGVTAQRIGIMTNKHELKTSDYGEWYRDKSRHSNKEVDNFKYYDSVIPKLKKILGAS